MPFLGCLKRRHVRGFSLIEALVGMIVLTIVAIAVLGAIPAAYGLTQQDRVRVQAVSAGQEYLDSIRQYVKASGVDTGLPAPPSVPIDTGGGMPSTTNTRTQETFTMTPACTSRSLFSFDCTVTVSWPAGAGATQHVDVESYVTSQAGF